MNDIMRILADCPPFKHIDNTKLNFKNKPRNLNLGVGLDNVNPIFDVHVKMVNLVGDCN